MSYEANKLLNDDSKRVLDDLVATLGKSPEEVIATALTEYASEIGADTRNDDWKEKLLAIAGLWKDRTDLPDFDEIRRSADRRVWPEDAS